MEMTGNKCAGCRKKTCTGCYLAGQIHNEKEKNAVFPMDFEPEESTGLGLVFDVGTTTIAGLLWDLGKKEQLAAKAIVNPGRFAGSDVISRISYVRECTENRQRMQRILVDKLDEMAGQLLECIRDEWWKKDRNSKERIKRVVLVGNTVMCEFLLGVSVEGLARAPFHKAYEGCVGKRGSELGFSFLKEARITVLPAIEGFVGADALAVHTYIKHKDNQRYALAVDIGTNGEILLFGDGQDYACSAAAGPALEGAAVYQGMGAVTGAIEEIKLAGSFPREDIYCKVIGGAKPKGICGSGLVDALAVLLKLGVVEANGYLRSADEARKAGVREQICRRIVVSEGEKRFLLTNADNPVYITPEDIRQLQLAKGAIRAGIEILLQKEKIKKDDIAHLYLAGAFGSYIKIESAVEIGLLPDIPQERITHVGNCAGTGALMALLSGKIIEEMEADAGQIRHIELAKEESFQEYFMQAMALKRI